ncbi:MAG: GNAT family N-acetyltransferase [Roseiflexaceae bacterium]|nr:GNAT family N-acetyltransferase [Roseiflexaceae bacterium]
MSQLIRPYKPTDESAVVAVWHRSSQAVYTFLPNWEAFTLDVAQEVFHEVIVPRCDIWVVCDDQQIVAFLALNNSYIDRLYVDPSAQRQRWGSRLLAHAKSLHPGGLELHTHQQNHGARALYERHGFVAVQYGISPPPESAPDVEYHWRPENVS